MYSEYCIILVLHVNDQKKIVTYRKSSPGIILICNFKCVAKYYQWKYLNSKKYKMV